MSVYRGNYWGIDPADWTAELDEGFILRPPTRDAVLEIDTYDSVTTDQWRRMLAHAGDRAPASTHMERAVCGQFAGVTYEYLDEEGGYHREWLLSCADLALFITLVCPQRDAPRYQEVANRMLSTLKECRA